jgi:hypothetical protein
VAERSSLFFSFGIYCYIGKVTVRLSEPLVVECHQILYIKSSSADPFKIKMNSGDTPTIVQAVYFFKEKKCKTKVGGGREFLKAKQDGFRQILLTHWMTLEWSRSASVVIKKVNVLLNVTKVRNTKIT